MEDRIEQIDAMRMGVEYRQPIRIRAFEVMVRPLTMGETLQIAAEVMKDLQSVPEFMRMPAQEAAMLARRTLILATTSDVGKTDSTLSELILQRCTPEEIQHLYNQYVDVTERANPSLDKMAQNDVLELAEALKKSPSELIKLSRSQLLSVASHLLTSVA